MFGVKDVVISSVFLKQQFKLTIVIRQVNDLLKDKSKKIICNDNVAME